MLMLADVACCAELLFLRSVRLHAAKGSAACVCLVLARHKLQLWFVEQQCCALC